MSYELDFDNIEYDRGYGIQCGTLVIEVEPIFTDESFDAHGPGGNLQLYGDTNALTDFEILGATMFFVGNNGEELGEMEMDSDTVLKLVSHAWIFERLIARHY